jgi:ankyrin repeat protein
MDAKKLPARPDLDQYRKQAKELVKAFRSGESSTSSRVVSAYKAASKEAPKEISLADAQFVIAREHCFASWPKFSEHIKGVVTKKAPICDFELAVEAIVTGNLRALELLLRRNPDLVHARSTRTHEATLLHYTAANGVEDFLQKTPKNIVQIAECLLKAGAEVDATAEMYGGGATTLGLAVTSVHPFLAGVQNELADVLLTHGADIDHPQGAGNGQAPINGCLANGRVEAAEHLAKRGARLNLEAAAGVGRLEVVQKFVTPEGTLIGASEHELKSALKWACAYGRVEVVRFLLQGKLDVNEIHRGETPLHWAAYGGHIEVVRLLLKHKARIDIQDTTFGGTALGWAVYAWGEARSEEKREKYYELAEMLVAAGASIDPAWLNEKDRGIPLDKMTSSERRMAKALGLGKKRREEKEN